MEAELRDDISALKSEEVAVLTRIFVRLASHLVTAAMLPLLIALSV